VYPTPYYMVPEQVEDPAKREERLGFIGRISAMIQAFTSNVDVREDLVSLAPGEVLSRTGTRDALWGALSQLWGVASPLDYIKTVDDCRRLGETNPIFSAIRRKLTRTIAEVPTTVKFAESDRTAEASEIATACIKRIQWNEKKEERLGKMLDEGGQSSEVVLSTQRRGIDRVEYRPHDSIRPLVDRQGAFLDPKEAYEQIDRSTGGTAAVAKFALWQIVDVNLEESAFHNRGIPHLQSARQVLEYVGIMTRGLMQKWLRESGSIEHFSLEDSRHPSDIDEFVERNQAALRAGPENAVRQFITRGKWDIKRIFADSKAQSTEAIDFMIDLVLLASGVSREVMGWKGHLTLKDMVEVAIANYYQVLNKIQSRDNVALAKVIDLELMLHGIVPADVPYEIEGGRFELVRHAEIPKEAIETRVVSRNDIRRSCGLPPVDDPAWEIPGYYNTEEEALEMARASGIDVDRTGQQPSAESDAMTTSDLPVPAVISGEKRRKVADMFVDSRVPSSVRLLNNMLGDMRRRAA
jgi:hypothetical protein